MTSQQTYPDANLKWDIALSLASNGPKLFALSQFRAAVVSESGNTHVPMFLDLSSNSAHILQMEFHYQPYFTGSFLHLSQCCFQQQ